MKKIKHIAFQTCELSGKWKVNSKNNGIQYVAKDACAVLITDLQNRDSIFEIPKGKSIIILGNVLIISRYVIDDEK